MHALGMLAPTTVVDAVVTELADRGRVAVIQETGPIDTDRRDAVDTRYRLGPDGWDGGGEPRSVQDVLDHLAGTHDYAVIVGFPGARIPHLVVGDEDARRVLKRVEEPSAVDPGAVADSLEDTQEYESLESLVAKAKQAEGEEFAGAIATFTGRVRAREDAQDERTDYLEFEQYADVAEDRLATIREELSAREGVYEVLVHHRTGVVEAGEDIVFVVVLAGHRTEAFETVEDGINRLKDEVPIFKKEVTVGEEFWVHDRP